MKRVLLVALLMVTAGVSLGSAPAGAQDETDPDGCAARAPADVSLVIDRSGSMSGDKIQTARDGATRLVENLTTQDQSGLVSFASSATLDKSLSFDHALTISEIGDLVASGGTDIGSGIDLSANDFANNGRTSARPIMIVLSDGVSSGDPIAAADAAKAQGIEIFSIALGSDADHTTMEAIASEPTEDHFFAPADTQELLVAFEELTGAVTKSAVIAEAYNLDIRVEDPTTGTSVIVDRLNQQTMPIGSSGDVANVTVPVAAYNISATALYAEATGEGGETQASADALAQLTNLTIRDPSDNVILSTGMLTAASSATASQGAASANADGTSLASVTVDGTTMDANVPVNTTISLGPLGNVTLNEQNTRVVDGQAEQSVRLIHASLVAGSATVEVTVSAARTAASCGVSPTFDNPEENEDEPTVTLPDVVGLPDFGPTGIEICAFEDNMESGVGDWTHSGSQDEWELGTPSYGATGAASGDNAWGTDLDGPYNNSADQVLSTPPVDLTGFSSDEAVNLTFALYFHSENYYDGGVVEAQNADGVTRLTPAEGPAYDSYTYRPGGAAWSGNHGGWQNVTFDVSEYAGEEVTFRFRMASDGSITAPGFYIDDVSVCGELAVDPGQVPSPPTPPSASLSCVFQDDMESGEGAWTHSGPGDEWELGTPTYGPPGAASGENAWGTDLDDWYSPNSDQVLTSPVISLKTALPGDPIEMSANIYSYTYYYDDAAWVEVDNGTAVTKIHPVTGPSYGTYSSHSPAWHFFVAGWHETTFNLTEFAGEEIQLRFRLASDSIYQRAGLYVDDVSVCIDRPVEDPELPTTASLSCVFQDDMESGEGAWTHSGAGDEWELGTPSYYVYEAASGDNTWGTDLDSAYSSNSDQVLTSPVIDLRTALPGDPIEMNANIWSYTYIYDDAAWVEVDNGTAVTKIDPVTGPSYTTYSSHSPAWHHYVGGWHETTFNLTEFAGEEIQLRFRLASDSIYQRAGLFVDDVSVCIDRPVEDPELPTTASLSCVFQDDMESGEGAWTHSGPGDEWELGTPTYGAPGAASGENAWGTDLSYRYGYNTDQVLTSPVIDLRAVPPGLEVTLTTNIWADLYGYGDAAWVEVDDGTTVTKIKPADGALYGMYGAYAPSWAGYIGGWEETSFDLSPFAGEEIQLGFRLVSDSYYTDDGLYVDDVSVCLDGLAG